MSIQKRNVTGLLRKVGNMTRTHFQAIAEVLREARRTPGKGKEHLLDGERLAEKFADMCQGQNSRFDRERFLSACDPKQEYKPRQKMGNGR